MTELRSDFLNVLEQRGYIHQCTDLKALDALAAAGPITGYIGFDCTAPSLHVGSLVQIMMLRWLQKTGHKPIVLMGGGTTKVGDPSGRDETRKLLDDAAIAANMAGIRQVFDAFLEFGKGASDAVVVNNDDWLSGLDYVGFLRDYGRHFSINRMMGFDSVKLRLEREQPLTFLEFNYMILQAYDFLELARRSACVLQLGGSDQWGNIINGVELGRRIDERTLYGLTTPLLTTASGEKMGKTSQGAVWLDPTQVSPYNYFQFWRNVDDGDVGRFLKLFTELSLDEIGRLELLNGVELNEAKKILALEATTMRHGRDAANAACRTAEETFEAGGAGANLPVIEVPAADLDIGLPAFELFHRAGLAATKGEARRLCRDGGARVNDVAMSDEMRVIGRVDLDADGKIKLSAGKKRHAVVRPT